MSIQSNGPIMWSDIRDAFGGSNPVSIADYYADSPSGFATLVSGAPVQGQPFNLSNLKGKSKPLGQLPMLDSLSPTSKQNCCGAYSLYRVSMSYNGPTVLIRRSTDSIEMDFYGSITGVLGTNINGDGTILSTWLNGAIGYIKTWYDQSGFGNHAIQTNTANQPKIGTFPYIDFTGQNFFVLPDGTVPAGNAPYTMCLKHGYVNQSGGLHNVAIGSGVYNVSAGLANALNVVNNTYYNYWWGNDYIGGTYATGNDYIVRHDGSARQANINGTFIASYTSAARNSSSVNNTIGRGQTDTIRYFQGEMAHVFLFKNNFPDIDMRMMTRFLRDSIVRSGLQLWLDVSSTTSYSDSGVLLKDLSGMNRHFTLTGSGWSVNSTSRFLTIPSGVAANGPINSVFNIASDHTIEILVQPGSQGFSILNMTGTSGERMINILMPWPFDQNIMYDVRWNPEMTIANRTKYASVSINTLRHYAFRTQTATTPTLEIFENGVSKSSSNSFTPSGNWGGLTRLFYDGSSYWQGNFYYIRIYNRALSNAEITQNYNTSKTKYGF